MSLPFVKLIIPAVHITRRRPDPPENHPNQMQAASPIPPVLKKSSDRCAVCHGENYPMQRCSCDAMVCSLCTVKCADCGKIRCCGPSPQHAIAMCMSHPDNWCCDGKEIAEEIEQAGETEMGMCDVCYGPVDAQDHDTLNLGILPKQRGAFACESCVPTTVLEWYENAKIGLEEPLDIYRPPTPPSPSPSPPPRRFLRDPHRAKWGPRKTVAKKTRPGAAVVHL